MQNCCRCLSLVALLAMATHAEAVIIGNNTNVGRGAPSDGATTVFQVYSNAPIPAAGTIDSFVIFDQSGNNTVGNGHAYVLRPTGGNNYFVVSDNVITPTSTNVTLSIPVAPISVQAGDLIAHYGVGVPYSDGPLGGTFQQIYYSSPAAPIAGNTIVLPSGDFPHSAADPNFGGTFYRDYAFAANLQAIPPATPAIVGTFTGGDPGESTGGALDFTGNFKYAIHASDTGTHTVGDATFVPHGGLISPGSVTAFGTPNYGASANDTGLAGAVDFVHYDPNVTVTLPGLTVGTRYRLQVLENEACCPGRTFDVFVDGLEAYHQFNPGGLMGIDQAIGAFMQYDFTARNSTVLVTLARDGGTDPNAMIDALTLEILPVPEPSSIALAGFALIGLIFATRRKA